MLKPHHRSHLHRLYSGYGNINKCNNHPQHQQRQEKTAEVAVAAAVSVVAVAVVVVAAEATALINHASPLLTSITEECRHFLQLGALKATLLLMLWLFLCFLLLSGLSYLFLRLAFSLHYLLRSPLLPPSLLLTFILFFPPPPPPPRPLLLHLLLLPSPPPSTLRTCLHSLFLALSLSLFSSCSSSSLRFLFRLQQEVSEG